MWADDSDEEGQDGNDFDKVFRGYKCSALNSKGGKKSASEDQHGEKHKGFDEDGTTVKPFFLEKAMERARRRTH